MTMSKKIWCWPSRKSTYCLWRFRFGFLPSRLGLWHDTSLEEFGISQMRRRFGMDGGISSADSPGRNFEPCELEDLKTVQKKVQATKISYVDKCLEETSTSQSLCFMTLNIRKHIWHHIRHHGFFFKSCKHFDVIDVRHRLGENEQSLELRWTQSPPLALQRFIWTNSMDRKFFERRIPEGTLFLESLKKFCCVVVEFYLYIYIFIFIYFFLQYSLW